MAGVHGQWCAPLAGNPTLALDCPSIFRRRVWSAWEPCGEFQQPLSFAGSSFVSSEFPLKSFLTALAFAAGSATSAQAAVNAQLGRRLHPFQAALASFTIGSLVCLAICLALRLTWPSASKIAAIPWWPWLGGALGTLYVTTAISVTHRIGVAAMLAVVIAGQMAMSLLIDHFGWFHIPPRTLSGPRLAGALLVVTGMVLMVMRTRVD